LKMYRAWFLGWLLKRSPYRVIFSTKSVRKAYNKGVIVRTDKPANLVIGGLTAQRMTWEQTSTIVTMFDLVMAGMPENAAYVISHAVSIFDGNIMTRGSNNHSSFDSRADNDTILRFNSGKLKHRQAKFEDLCQINGIQSSYGEGRNHGDNILSLALAHCEGNEEKVQNLAPNPFARQFKLRDVSGKTTEEKVKALVAYVNYLIEGE